MTDEPIWLRPERAATGRPAERSRAEITAAALAVADRGGPDAVSMRGVAEELGTGPASLYRYVTGRDDLLDLMVDATAAEYRLAAPTGDAALDLADLAEQALAIMLRHPWLPELVLTRPVLGPGTVAVLDHVLLILDGYPGPAKLEVFALLNAITATFALGEIAASKRAGHAAAYLAYVAASGERPRVTELMAELAETDAGGRRRERLRELIGNLVDSLPTSAQ
ncbi:helix-turn-helix domain-containing protein [Glycomyces sp. NPDC046736]|uniref:TetR/AcrR family transcriptional regulator n=1 Tax=Glycomyces sp. NPDC046736 TaxID=3155615 RepID=UPI0033CD0568